MDTNSQRHDHSTGDENRPTVALSPVQQLILEELGEDLGDLFWHRKGDAVEWSPLVQARIAERVSFDGDIPELRTGNLPEGGMPAVPIYAEGTNTLWLGLGLLKASQAVRQELAEVQQQWLDGIEEDSSGALMESSKEMVFQVPGYAPGLPAEMRKVGVSLGEIRSLTPDERKQVAFRVLSTTQGRASAVPILERFLLEHLQRDGHQVKISTSRAGQVAARGRWVVFLDGGPAEWSDRYSPVEMARTVLLAQLRKELGDLRGNLLLIVRPVGLIHERRVGWEAIILEEQKSHAVVRFNEWASPPMGGKETHPSDKEKGLPTEQQVYTLVLPGQEIVKVFCGPDRLERVVDRLRREGIEVEVPEITGPELEMVEPDASPS